jgi:histidyl-tRNA synthetase
VEVISLGDGYLRSLGLSRYELQINSIGDEMCRPAYRDRLLEYLRANRDRLRDEHRDRFEDNPMRVLDCKDEACRAVAVDAPKTIDMLCEPCRAHLDGVLEGLDADGLKPVITPTLARGLDYYTRTAFEFVSEVTSLAQAGTLFGGGRYDGLAEALGLGPTPGIGWAAGVERLLLAGEHRPGAGGPVCDLYVAGTGVDAFALAAEARRAGLNVQLELGGRSRKGQLKQADRSGARFVAILGEEGTALRDMESGEQKTVEPETLLHHMRGHSV